jgi:hypothetical protein
MSGKRGGWINRATHAPLGDGIGVCCRESDTESNL